MHIKRKIRIAVAEENQYIIDFYDFIAVYAILCVCACVREVLGSSHLIPSCYCLSIFQLPLSLSRTFLSFLAFLLP